MFQGKTFDDKPDHTERFESPEIDLLQDTPFQGLPSYIFNNETSVEKSKINITAYFNNQAYHTPSIALGAVFNGLLRVALRNDENQITITTTNHPLPLTAQDRVSGQTAMDFRGFMVALHVTLGMAFLSGR